MAQDLASLLNIDSLQQQVQGNYAQALREKRQYQEISRQAGERFSGALSTSNPVALNPADVFGAYQSFNAAVKPGLTADQDILQQLVDLAKQKEANQLSKSKMQQDQANSDRQYQLEQDKIKLDAVTKGATYDPTTGSVVVAPKTDPDGKAIPRGSSAVAEVTRQGGSSFLKGGTAAERAAIAEEILSMGGVVAYRKQLPLDTLLTDSEKTQIGEQTNLLSTIDQALPLFAEDKLGGTGPLAQFIWGPIAGERTREMRRQSENLRAQYQKAISGAAISEQEAKRLSAFLPNSGKTETQNKEDLQRLKAGILINQEIFARAKQEGLTTKQAYDQYAADIFSKYGEAAPGSKSPAAGQKPSSGGYVIEEVK